MKNDDVSAVVPSQARPPVAGHNGPPVAGHTVPPAGGLRKITYFDLKPGVFIKVSGAAQNAYEITTRSEKKICMRRVKDGLEHCMDTGRLLDEVNRNLSLNGHLLSGPN